MREDASGGVDDNEDDDDGGIIIGNVHGGQWQTRSIDRIRTCHLASFLNIFYTIF